MQTNYWLKIVQKTRINVVFLLANLFMTISTFFLFSFVLSFNYQPHKMVKYTHTNNSSAAADGLFECVWVCLTILAFKILNVIAFVYNGLKQSLTLFGKNSFIPLFRDCTLEMTVIHFKREISWCQHAWWKSVFLMLVPHWNWKLKLLSRITIYVLQIF